MKKNSFFGHIVHEVRVHHMHYALMLGVSGLYLVSLFFLQPNHLQQFLVSVIFISFYVGWGIFHHWLENSLTFRTVLEYVLIGGTILILLEIFLVG